MKKYIGVKLINAEEMDKVGFMKSQNLEYNGENIDGYKVVYKDGYTSWSPKNTFEEAYRLIDNMTFGLAIEAIKKGYKVTREGWNGRGIFLFLVPGSKFKVNRPPLLGIYPEGTEINYQAHIDMRTANNSIVPWLASQTDILAEDWKII